jgi:hypothetical protein
MRFFNISSLGSNLRKRPRLLQAADSVSYLLLSLQFFVLPLFGNCHAESVDQTQEVAGRVTSVEIRPMFGRALVDALSILSDKDVSLEFELKNQSDKSVVVFKEGSPGTRFLFILDDGRKYQLYPPIGPAYGSLMPIRIAPGETTILKMSVPAKLLLTAVNKEIVFETECNCKEGIIGVFSAPFVLGNLK